MESKWSRNGLIWNSRRGVDGTPGTRKKGARNHRMEDKRSRNEVEMETKCSQNEGKTESKWSQNGGQNGVEMDI